MMTTYRQSRNYINVFFGITCSFCTTTAILISAIAVFNFSKCIAADSDLLVFVQISDVHISPYDQNPKYSYRNAYLKRAISICNEIIKPDFVIDTGDISDFGTVSEWEKYKKIMSDLKLPHYVIPGNHDGYKALLAQWPGHFQNSHFNFAGKGVRFIGINSVKNSRTYPDNIRGTITDPEFDWLKKQLSEIKPETPVCIFSHHLPVGKRGKKYNIDDNREAALKLIKPYNVPLWAGGHYHYFLATNTGKTTFLISQSLSKSRKSPVTKRNSRRGFRVYCVYKGIFSTRFMAFDNGSKPKALKPEGDFFPCSVIVSPVSELFYNTGSKKGNGNKITAKIFGDSGIEKVEVYVDGKFAGNMKTGSDNLWHAVCKVNLNSGKHKIKIVVSDRKGGKDIQEIMTGPPKHGYISEYNFNPENM